MIKSISRIVLLACCLGSLAVAQSPQQALDSVLIQPEVVLRNSDQLGLSEEQVARIRAAMRDVAPKSQTLIDQADERMGRLAELLAADEVDENAVLNQLDEVLNVEQNQRRLHMKAIIRVQQELSVAQRRAALKLQQTASGKAETQQRLRSKLKRIQEEMKAQARSGKQPADALAQMQKFQEFIRVGKIEDAEAVLNRVILMLGIADRDGTPAEQGPSPEMANKLQQMQQLAQQIHRDGKDAQHIQEQMKAIRLLLQRGKMADAEKRVDKLLKLMKEQAENKDDPAPGDDVSKYLPKTQLVPRSFEQTVIEVNSLREADVAWRTIRWRTCLIEGIQESRRQNKPIMLWVFIDRPIDDERC